jgi:ubiquinone/menaquinone biosynthesis C-methylase UbiE
MDLYKHPLYYEIAFSFRDISQEVDFFEAAIRKFSRRKVRRVLELASGSSPYLEEWHRRGYQYLGLDVNPRMLEFGRRKAKQQNIRIKLFRRSMTDFSLSGIKVDLAYVLLGSLYVKSNKEFFTHLDSVARVLKRGGLYLLEGVVWVTLLNDNKQSWSMRKSRIIVKTTYRAEIIDPLSETYHEFLTLQISDHGKRKTLESKVPLKFFFPQEFLSLVQWHAKFDFLGWFNNFNLHEIAKATGRQIVILRRR